MEEEFVPGDRRAKIKLIIILLLAMPIYLIAINILNFIFAQNEILFQSNPELAVKNTSDILLITAIIKSLIYGCLSIYFVSLGIRVKRAGRWPLPRMKMPFKTKIRRGRYAKIFSILLITVPCVFMLYVAVDFYAWYSISKMMQPLAQ